MSKSAEIYLLAFLIGGAIVGWFIARPIFKFLSARAKRKRYYHIAGFFESLRSASVFLVPVVALNLRHLKWIPQLNNELINKFIYALNLTIIFYLLAEVVVMIYDRYAKFKETKSTSLFHILIRLVIYAIGIVVITDGLGFQIAPILTALGVGGLAVALALQDTLSNLFSGIHILAARQLQPGDYIQLDSGEEGYVIDINWRNTEIKTLLENVVIVPNSKISSSITTNYFTLQKNLYFHVLVGVHYDSDLSHVEKVTLETAHQTLNMFPGIPPDFLPKVRFYEYGESSINLKVWMACDVYENQFIIRHEFIKMLHQRYNKEGIIIPFPIRTLYFQNQLQLQADTESRTNSNS